MSCGFFDAHNSYKIDFMLTIETVGFYLALIGRLIPTSLRADCASAG